MIYLDPFCVLTADLKVEGLDETALQHMTNVAENMKTDGRMGEVKAAWAKYFSRIGGIGVASFASKTFPSTTAQRDSLHADVDLND